MGEADWNAERIALSRTRARARLKRMKREGLMLGCLALAAVGLIVMAAQMRSSPLMSMAALGFGFAVLALTMLLAADLWGRREADLETLAGGLDRDQVQSAEALNLVVMSAFGLLYTLFGAQAAWRIAIGHGDSDDVWRALFSLAFPLVVMTSIVSNKTAERRAGARAKPADELTVHFRQSALKWSMATAGLSVLALYVAGLFQAPLTVAGMPVVCQAAAMTAALRYWWLDRQASRG